MKYILYYSNFCEHCKRLLLYLARQKICETDISYICIDNRKQVGDDTYALLTTGKMIMIPKNIKSVPTLVLLNRGNTILVGDKIKGHFTVGKKEHLMADPDCFSFGEMSGYSDTFSYLDSSADDLMATGNGGTRIMHGYVPLDYVDTIETPPEDENSGGGGDSTDSAMEELIKKRNQEINLNG